MKTPRLPAGGRQKLASRRFVRPWRKAWMFASWRWPTSYSARARYAEAHDLLSMTVCSAGRNGNRRQGSRFVNFPRADTLHRSATVGRCQERASIGSTERVNVLPKGRWDTWGTISSRIDKHRRSRIGRANGSVDHWYRMRRQWTSQRRSGAARESPPGAVAALLAAGMLSPRCASKRRRARTKKGPPSVAKLGARDRRQKKKCDGSAPYDDSSALARDRPMRRAGESTTQHTSKKCRCRGAHELSRRDAGARP